MDRVSNLPDEILCHVLSFLTTKEAALTSILAKRWRNLLAFVPNLSVDDSVFLHPREGKLGRKGILQSFTSFVDRVLALQGNSPIKKVSIKLLSQVHYDCVDRWIRNVLERGVSDLDLCFRFGDGFRSYCLYSKNLNQKLVKMQIRSDIDLGWCSGEAFMPMLKTLVLDSVELCEDSFRSILEACPALEELDMANIIWSDWDHILSKATLKSLRIKPSCRLYTFSFDTPSLVYLDYSDFVAKNYPLFNFKCLLEARINLIVTEGHALQLGSVVKFMNGIQNVQKLYLTCVTLEVLSLSCESIPVFNNLKWLGFRSGKSQLKAVPVLLKNCPHLETLKIEGLLHRVTDTCGDVCDCISQEDKGRSQSSCPVKNLEIKEFRGTRREIKMIRHFLDYFPYLENIEISDEMCGPAELDVPQVSDLKVLIMELYLKSFSCNVNIRLSDSLNDKLISQ